MLPERIIQPRQTDLLDLKAPLFEQRRDLWRRLEWIEGGLKRAKDEGDPKTIEDHDRWLREVKNQIGATFSVS